MENAPELRSVGFPSSLLCFPLWSSFAQVDLTPMSHLDMTHPVTPPCESLFHLSSLPSVAANGGICYCQFIWPPLHPSAFALLLAKALFLFCSFIMLWFCHFFIIFFMCIFRTSSSGKRDRIVFDALFSLPAVWPWKENPPKIRSMLYYKVTTRTCVLRHDRDDLRIVYVARGIMLIQISWL